MTVKRNPPVDISKGYLPIVVAMGMLALVAGGAYSVGQFAASLKSENDRANEKFAKIDSDLTAIRSLIEGGGFIRRTEFELWCRNTEVLNKGFKCGNIK